MFVVLVHQFIYVSWKLCLFHDIGSTYNVNNLKFCDSLKQIDMLISEEQTFVYTMYTLQQCHSMQTYQMTPAPLIPNRWYTKSVRTRGLQISKWVCSHYLASRHGMTCNLAILPNPIESWPAYPLSFTLSLFGHS